MGHVSGRIVGIRQNQGPPIKERQYGAKVKSGLSNRKDKDNQRRVTNKVKKGQLETREVNPLK